MDNVEIHKFNKLNVYYENEKVSLPEEYRQRVYDYWNELLRRGRKFFNGDVFSIYKVDSSNQCIDIHVRLTDYAHFLYTIHKEEREKFDCRVIHTSVLIKTSNDKIAIGEMNKCTCAPLKLQFIGGGLDKDDIEGTTLNLTHNIKKEISEELGIDTNDSRIVTSLKPYYLVNGGMHEFMSLIFVMELKIDDVKFSEVLEKHNKRLALKNEMQEIRKLIFINNDKEHMQEFIDRDTREKDQNIIPVLKAEVGIIEF